MGRVPDSIRRRACGSLAALALLPGVALGEEDASDHRSLPAVRLVQPPVIDGDLSDACWERAAVADRFIDAFLGTPAADQTVVRIAYDDQGIYVAFHAYDSRPSAIVAHQTKRGSSLAGEDILVIHIDPFHSHKGTDRSIFQVNALGTQFARLGGERATKLEWEGKWHAAARIVTDGWTVEMAVPWSILNYPAVQGPTTCGLNFSRFQQRTNIVSYWSNVGTQELFDRDGHWLEVQFPRFRPQMSILPYAAPGWQEGEGSTVHAGLDLRQSLTPSVTLVGTVNPDFETVEGAVEGIDFSYGKRFVPDRRPFFLEGARVYATGGEAGRYYHSPRIGRFDGGLSLYGKLTARDTLGALAAFDFGRRADWIVKARHEFGARSGAGLALISRDDERFSNRVLAFGQGSRRGAWGIDTGWATSWVDGHVAGSAGSLHFIYTTPRWYAEVTPHFIQPGFRADLGLISFTGFRGVNSYLDYSTEWRRGPLRSLGISSWATDNVDYDGRLFQQQRAATLSLHTRSDQRIRLGWEGGRFRQFRDSVFGVDWRARSSDPFRNYGIGVSWGRRAEAPILFLTPSVTWRFGRRLTFGLASSILRHDQDREQHVFTFNVDFSPRRGIVGRLVSRDGEANAYAAYRQSGYGGVETFVILGDPNADRFRRKLTLKTIWPF